VGKVHFFTKKPILFHAYGPAVMQSKLQTADRLLSLFIWLVDFFIYFLIFESQCIYYYFLLPRLLRRKAAEITKYIRK